VTAEARFEAMGSWGHVIVEGGPDDACAQARARIDDLERRWSRFLPDSEISRMNAGGAAVVSEETAGLVQRAHVAHQATGGRFDAMVLAALVGAGYDRAVGVVVDAPRSGFDPGGIGKGLAADLVAAEVCDAGADGCLVNVGGDLRAVGEPPTEDGWVVTVPDARRPGEELLRAALPAGAVATSSRLERRWQAGDTEVHHLIDPFTGEPADSDVLSATVFAGEAWEAEVLVKAVTVGGTAAFDVLPGIPVVAVTTSGEVRSANVPVGLLR